MACIQIPTVEDFLWLNIVHLNILKNILKMKLDES